MDEDIYEKYIRKLEEPKYEPIEINDYIKHINEKNIDWQYEDNYMRKRRSLTAEDRLKYKREREALVGSLITQEGAFCGALVKEHVRGSQYVVRMADGSEVFASHKKRLEGQRGLSGGGWKLWEDRS